MQNNNIKISIIMPVYNVEQYLVRAVESIQNQNFNDFELFLVDDGSTDASGKLCDKLSQNDSRIKVIHQQNMGAFAARNTAIDKAIGEYVCFFDSDDYIDENMLSDMYDLAKKYDANLVISGFYIHTYYDENNYITLDYIPNIDKSIVFYDKKDEFRMNAYKHFDKNMFYSPWNKLYKLSYIKNNNLKFPETYRDDFPFVVSIIWDIDKVVFTKKQYYHFIRKRADSETQKFVRNLYEKREDEHKLMIDLYNHWDMANNSSSKEMYSRRYIDRLIECMTNLFNKSCVITNNEKKGLIKRYLTNDNVAEALIYAKPKKLYLKLMYMPIRLKNVLLCYIMSKFINYIKSKNIILFSKLKTYR